MLYLTLHIKFSCQLAVPSDKIKVVSSHISSSLVVIGSTSCDLNICDNNFKKSAGRYSFSSLSSLKLLVLSPNNSPSAFHSNLLSPLCFFYSNYIATLFFSLLLLKSPCPSASQSNVFSPLRFFYSNYLVLLSLLLKSSYSLLSVD